MQEASIFSTKRQRHAFEGTRMFVCSSRESGIQNSSLNNKCNSRINNIDIFGHVLSFLNLIRK